MPYSVSIDNPELGEQSILIDGLGTFKNNTTTQVDDEQGTIFTVKNGYEPSEIKAYGVHIVKQGGE
jgi:hypothetical protein